MIADKEMLVIAGCTVFLIHPPSLLNFVFSKQSDFSEIVLSSVKADSVLSIPVYQIWMCLLAFEHTSLSNLDVLIGQRDEAYFTSMQKQQLGMRVLLTFGSFKNSFPRREAIPREIC